MSSQSVNSASGPALIPLGPHAGKPSVPVVRPATVIGSRSSARIHLVSSTVSKAHALLVKSNGGVYIRDLASRSHVYINGEVVREADLQDGDLLKIGSFTFKFVAGPPPRQSARAAPPAELQVTGGEFPIPIEERVVLIGRRSTADIVLIEGSASTAHAVIFEMDGERYVRDLGSRTGTFVNGVSTHQHKLSGGDVIRVGETEIHYRLVGVPDSIQMTSDSGAGYALQAPAEEIALPAGTPHPELETAGGPDLMGQMVNEDISPQSAPQPQLSGTVASIAPEATVPEQVPRTEPRAVSEPPPITATASTDIEDLQRELLGDIAPPPESSILAAAPADSELHPRRGWRGTQTETPQAPAEPAPTQHDDEDVLKFSESAPAHDEHDGATAVLDQDALSTPDTDGQTVQHEPVYGDLIESAPEPAAEVDLSDLKLKFSEPTAPAADAPSPQLAEAAPLEIDVEAEHAQPTEIEIRIEPQTAPSDVEIDFSVPEPLEPATPLAELEKPAPPLKLSLEAEALLDATEKLTRRTRKSRKKPTEADLGEAVEPFLPLPPVEMPDPFANLPPIEKFDPFTGVGSPTPDELPELQPLDEADMPPKPLSPAQADQPLSTDVVSEAQPEPDFAIDLDAATESIELDEPALSAPQSTTDELSDTKFTRAVQEFVGESGGDIVELQGQEASEVDPSSSPAAPTSSPESGAELIEFAPVAPEEPRIADEPTAPPQVREVLESAPAPAHDELIVPREQDVPASKRASAAAPLDPFLLGANQENFLGGVPLPRAAPARAPAKGSRAVPLPRDPVEELIAEIDTAAAAAERAKSGLHADVPQIPPIDASDPKSASIARGFDGLAMPPARQADVFSAISPPGSDSPFADSASQPIGSRGATAQPDATAARSGAFHVPDDSATEEELLNAAGSGAIRGMNLADAAAARRPLRPSISEHAALSGRPAVLYADATDLDEDAPGLKSAASRRVILLLVSGLALIGTAVAGVYALLPVESRLEATLRYSNLEKRTQRDREEIQQDQLRRLRADYLRESARRKLLANPEISPGFLDDTVRYSRVVDRAYWTEGRSGPLALVVPLTGTNKHADAARLRALVTALYDDNKDTLINPKKSLQNAVQRLKEDIARHERRRDEVNGEIATQRILYERKPSAEQVRVLEEKLARQEQVWKRAVAAVKEAEAEFDRVKSGVAQSGEIDGSQLKDEELTKMQQELAQLQGRLQTSRDRSAERSKFARQKLDEAMQGFQQEIADARAAMNNNPELAAYIAAAQALQDATHQLIDDLIRRQEQQFQSLTELQSQLNEKMELRRSEMWQADKELQKLTEELAIVTRQYNAAIGSGLREESDEKLAQIGLLKSMIKARQELIPVDPGYAEAIQRIEQYISSCQKDITEDRRRTDELLSKLQRGFTSGTQIEKLPAEQKELARRLVEKLEAINEARTTYNLTLDAGADDAEPQLQQQIAALQAGIEARRKQLADERAGQIQNPELVKEKQLQVDALKSQAGKAEGEYFAAREELDAARRAVAEARASYERLEKLETERNDLQTLLRTQNDTLVGKQRELNEAVEPLPPGENDIRITGQSDRRPTYAAVAAVAIGGIFGGLVLMTLYRGRLPESFARADLRPIHHPVPQPASQGDNGQTPANRRTSNGNEDDHQPAVI